MQNSMGELFGIMNVLNPDEYGNEEEFLDRFGKEMPTPVQVQALQVRSSCFLQGNALQCMAPQAESGDTASGLST